MREIRTSGSTRGGALRSPPTLPALKSLPSRAREQALMSWRTWEVMKIRFR